jgi:hypothetical protein
MVFRRERLSLYACGLEATRPTAVDPGNRRDFSRMVVLIEGR